MKFSLLLQLNSKVYQMGKDAILVVGAAGQIGSELVMALREKHGAKKVIASDIREAGVEVMKSGPFEILDILNKQQLEKTVEKYRISEVFQLAALLSATAEENPMFAWELNMNGLFHTLELAREKKIDKLFWPSSIAIFGATTPKENTPQTAVMEPQTVYGISKQAGERWCAWYHQKYGIDVRSLRYPGLISYKSLPGGGTTDYAVDIFHSALKDKAYACFLNADTTLPMMYMSDAVRATLELMETPAEQIKIRSSYNISGMSFNPSQIAREIQNHYPKFSIQYHPDFRQEIAAGWPQSINDTQARQDWGWKAQYDLPAMVADMFKNLSANK